MTGDAIEEDMALEFKLLGKLGRIERIAWISDKHWVNAVARGVGPWVPGVEMQAFGAGREGDARDWAMGERVVAPF